MACYKFYLATYHGQLQECIIFSEMQHITCFKCYNDQIQTIIKLQKPPQKIEVLPTAVTYTDAIINLNNCLNSKYVHCTHFDNCLSLLVPVSSTSDDAIIWVTKLDRQKI